MTYPYPYSDCCPNLPGSGETYGPCDDGWCCTHETVHGAAHPLSSIEDQTMPDSRAETESGDRT